ncbi:MAG: peptide deformylase [Patescibacteria group bacterium]|jgi:peptide deformylase
MKIVKHPNKILSAKAKTISQEVIKTPVFRQLVLDMAEMMLKSDGAGLAAPQIGKSLQLAVINTKEGVLALVNPKITKKSLTREWGEEGCLSVPGYFGEVKRYKKVTCEYFNAQGEKKKIKAEGLLARVIQHELDHLNGILFIAKARNIKKIDQAKR